MILEKLTTEKIEEIKGKEIYCVEYSVSYLKELCGRYDILPQIEGVFDGNVRNQGKHIFEGKELEVYDYAYMKRLNGANVVLIITSDYYEEAYAKIKECLDVEMILGKVYYFVNTETEYEEYYRTKYKHSDLEDMILFRSGPHASSYVKGMDFGDNARALFEHILSENYNEKYKIVWMVKNPQEFLLYKNIKNVSFVSFEWSTSEKEEERDSYYYALCLSKYIFFTDAYGFARNCRPDQVRVQLWHGCGFKTRVNFVRCEKRYEYTTVISDLYARIHRDIYGLREDQILVTGYAKQDWLFHPISDEYKEILHIPEVPKYVFWLPTFRTTEKKLDLLNEYKLDSVTGLPFVNTIEQLKQLNQMLIEEDVVLVIKLHPFQDKSQICTMDASNIILLDNEQLVEEDIQVNQLLGWADGLISDYSSAAVDYMLLDRPIAFMLEDVEEYRSSRGFVFDNIQEWLPGMEIYSFEDLLLFIREVSRAEDSTKAKRQRLTQEMHKFQDDNNCKRILETLKITR